MSLIAYNNESGILPSGFINLGATCYFNALLQSILSCTSFIDIIFNERETFNHNSITRLIINYIENNRDYERLSRKGNSETKLNILKNKLNNFAPVIWKEMITVLCKKKNIQEQTFMQGQQCAGEGFYYLLESMEMFPIIQKLFLHRYKSLIHCFECKKWISDVESLYSLFDVEANLNSEQLDKFNKYHINSENMNEFISKHSSYVEGFKCNTCKKKDDKFKLNVLVMVPEILVVMSKKYTKEKKLDIHTEFPKQMIFNGTKNKMTYEAVAQIEHEGGKNGGHYWAIVKRKNGWFKINDMLVSPAEFQPTKNTYIVFYHLSQ